jgi:MFS family permease
MIAINGASHPKNVWYAVLGQREFRLLALSETLWLLGSQFYALALPWLVMKLTGDVGVLGFLYVLVAIPRLSLTTVGGVLCDRYSLKTLMIVAAVTRTFHLALLAWVVLSGQASTWVLYVFGFAYGVMEAFFHPARRTAVPLLARTKDLQLANVITYGIEQVMGFVGPVLAGVTIAWLGAGTLEADTRGIGLAFALDAVLTFAAVLTLCALRPLAPMAYSSGTPKDAEPIESGVLASLWDGIRHAWGHRETRTLVLMLGALNLFLISPVVLGVPWLVEHRLEGGSATLGVLMAGLAGGALLGTALAGSLPRLNSRQMWPVFIVVSGLGAFALAMLAISSSVLLAVFSTTLIGAGLSYLTVTATTWLQESTPTEWMGRTMSLLSMK